jgi:diadenosine tetraphosphate (Ap4A) HIT family hydrolase
MSEAPGDTFELHAQLQRDTLFVCDLPLSRVLLMNDSRYPWVILVPRIAAIREIHELSQQDQIRLWQETSLCAERLSTLIHADKMNVAALGNVVSQLHMHVIARKVGDAAWPQPVWGRGEAQPYTAPAGIKRVEALQLTFAR